MFQWASKLFNRKQKQEKRGVKVGVHDGKGGILSALGSSIAGTNVNEQSTISMPAIYAGVNQLAKSISTLPLFLYRTEGEGRTKATSDPRYRMLHTKPNPHTNKVDFWHDVIVDCLIWRNAFIFLEKDAAGLVSAMYRLRPDMMYVDFDNGEKIYYYHGAAVDDKSPNVYFSDDEIAHIKGERGVLSERHQPKPLFHELARSLGISLATEQYSEKYYSQGTTLGGIVTGPSEGKADPEQIKLVRNDLEKRFSGLDNAHRFGILQHGMDFKPLNDNANDAQLLEAKKFNVIEVARLIGVPPSKLQSLEQTNYATAEQEAISFRQDSIRPWATRIEAEIESKVIREAEQGVLDAEFNLDALERANLETRYNAYATGVNNGFIMPNEARALENKNPVEGGDNIFIPLNLQQLGESAGSTDDEGVRQQSNIYELRDRIKRAYTTLFNDAYKRIVNKEYKALKRAVDKYKNQPQSFDKWADDFYERLRGDIREALYPIVDASLQQMEHIVEVDSDKRENLINAICYRCADRYIEQSREYLPDARNVIDQWVAMRLSDTADEQTNILNQITNKDTENDNNE